MAWARVAAPTGLRHKAQGWPRVLRPTPGKGVTRHSTLKGLRVNPIHGVHPIPCCLTNDLLSQIDNYLRMAAIYFVPRGFTPSAGKCIDSRGPVQRGCLKTAYQIQICIVRPEGPQENRPGRQAGIRLFSMMSAEGAALCKHCK